MIEQLILKIKNELKRIFPQLIDLYHPPASAKLIAQVEKKIGQTFPPSLKQLYMLHNGQADGPGLFFDWAFLSLEELAQEWETWSEIEEKYQIDFSIDSLSVPRGYIQEVYVSSGWIPISKDFSGNNYAVDMMPDSKGTQGQIIVFGRDYDDKYVLAPSLEKMLEHYIEKLKCDQYEIGEEFLYIAPPKYQPKFTENKSSKSEFRKWKKGLNERWLEALDYVIEGLTSMEQLQNIHRLSLIGTQISDLIPVAKFTELREFVASATKITSIKTIAENQFLKKLILGNIPLKSLEGIQKCHNLADLSIRSAPIKSLSELSQQKNLKKLDVGGTKIVSLNEISELTELIDLNICDTRIKSLAPIKNFKKLINLDISGTKLKDLDILPEFTSLASVNIAKLKIKDFSPLIDCKNIGTVTCEYKQFEKLKETLPYKLNIAIYGSMTEKQEQIWSQYL